MLYIAEVCPFCSPSLIHADVLTLGPCVPSPANARSQALKSTAVTHSCYIPRFCAGIDALVVAKGGRIEVYPAGEEGLASECVGEEVWGVVVGLEWLAGEVSHRGAREESEESSEKRLVSSRAKRERPCRAKGGNTGEGRTTERSSGAR